MVATGTKPRSADWTFLEEEFVLLSVASRVAYRTLVPYERQVLSELEVSRLLPRFAAALAAVAPVYESADGSMRQLRAGDLGARLLKPTYESRAALDELYVRRGDLHNAIEALKRRER